MKKFAASSLLLLALLTGCNEQKPLPPISMEADPTPPAFKMFFITPDKVSRNGQKIGCGDGIISEPVFLDQKFETINDKLTGAYNQLLNYKDSPVPGEGEMNPLANSDLKLDSVDFKDGKATINISGQLSLAGECDNPRVEAQLMTTGLQFSSDVTDLAINLNGKPLKDALSLK